MVTIIYMIVILKDSLIIYHIKKLMKVLTKYIADGTVLDMIWAWLKTGYMEEGKYMETNSGSPQGGVISPLLSNVYLNELDWELEKAGIKFVRYCDDFLLFCKDKRRDTTSWSNCKKSDRKSRIRSCN